MKRCLLTRKTPLRAAASVRPPKRDRSDEFASYVPKPRKATMALSIGLEPPRAAAKPKTVHYEGWLEAVRSIELCVLCKGYGTEPAHRNETKGKGLKTHDCWTAAICRACHSEIDQGKTMDREAKRSEIDNAILLTLAELVQAGKVVVK